MTERDEKDEKKGKIITEDEISSTPIF